MIRIAVYRMYNIFYCNVSHCSVQFLASFFEPSKIRIIKGSFEISEPYLIASAVHYVCTIWIQLNPSMYTYFTVEALTCFDSYNQPRLGGGQLFEHAAIEPWKCLPKSISTLLPCSCINN